LKLADVSIVNLNSEANLEAIPKGNSRASAGDALAIQATAVKLGNPSHAFRFASMFVLAAVFLLGFSACDRKGHRVLEVNYVSAPQATLRDQVATIYNRVGTVKNGDRVEVLEREKRFSRVRTADGLEGWMEQRYLVDQQTYDGLQKLKQENLNDPVQAPGVLRNETNLHLTPGRETEHLYQLSAGAKVSLLKRGTAEKQSASPTPSVKSAAKKASSAEIPSGPPLEDWWLVRDAQSRVGWVLARMVDLDIPLEVAQYAEGQRFVAVFVLNQVQDAGKDGADKSKEGTPNDRDKEKEKDNKVSQYLCAITEPHDGLPYDYDQIRVFTWNVRKHRYETAYREHGLNGVLPVTVTNEDFEKEGSLPVFILRVKDDSGNITERKYKLNTPIVRRVLAPGEQKAAPRPAKKARRR
jgi:SH3-like domain-containing protein